MADIMDGLDISFAIQSENLGPLPKNVKRRVCALKKLQLKNIEIESDFYKRVHALEIEFEGLFKKVNDERRQIIAGEKEPTDAEADVPLLSGVDKEALDKIYELSKPDTDEKGIKNFWLTALKGHEMIADLIQDHDEPILEYLTDITSSALSDPHRFTVEFHFAKNPYFKNSVLSKTYFLEISQDPERPFEFDGPRIIRVTCDEIQWEDGKDVTKKTVKKKQKKGTNAGKFLTKVVKADSFFNFFSEIKGVDERNEEEGDIDDHEDMLQADFEIGQLIRDTIITRAVLFFTGEVHNDDMFDYPGEDDGDFSEEDD